MDDDDDADRYPPNHTPLRTMFVGENAARFLGCLFFGAFPLLGAIATVACQYSVGSLGFYRAHFPPTRGKCCPFLPNTRGKFCAFFLLGSFVFFCPFFQSSTFLSLRFVGVVASEFFFSPSGDLLHRF